MMGEQEGRSPCRTLSDFMEEQQSSSYFTNVPSKSAVSECLGAWLHYLQMLNGLCAGGSRLSQCLSSLAREQAGGAASAHMTAQCLAGWDELARATVVATATVKAHVVAALQHYLASSLAAGSRPPDLQRLREDCQQMICDNVVSLVNLQYQFCMACSECLGGSGAGPAGGEALALSQASLSSSDSAKSGVVAPSPLAPLAPHQAFLHTLRHGEQTGPLPTPGVLLSMKAPFPLAARSPLHLPLFPLQGQRRWSEAAAAEMGGRELDDGSMRRWSMPWDGRGDGGAPPARLPPRAAPPAHAHRKLKLHHYHAAGDRSRSATPEWGGGSVASQDGLAEAIQLLSCRPGLRAPALMHQGVLCGLAEGWGADDERARRPPLAGNSRWGQRLAELTLHDADSAAPPLPADQFQGVEPMRNYSMWSGDARPFLRLPRASESDHPPS